jgi:hypothetical protein
MSWEGGGGGWGFQILQAFKGKLVDQAPQHKLHYGRQVNKYVPYSFYEGIASTIDLKPVHRAYQNNGIGYTELHALW